MIHGIDVNSQGRCAHWHSERDVVATPSTPVARPTKTCTSCLFAKGEHPFSPALIDVHPAKNRKRREVMSDPGVMVEDN